MAEKREKGREMHVLEGRKEEGGGCSEKTKEFRDVGGLERKKEGRR